MKCIRYLNKTGCLQLHWNWLRLRCCRITHNCLAQAFKTLGLRQSGPASLVWLKPSRCFFTWLLEAERLMQSVMHSVIPLISSSCRSETAIQSVDSNHGPHKGNCNLQLFIIIISSHCIWLLLLAAMTTCNMVAAELKKTLTEHTGVSSLCCA